MHKARQPLLISNTGTLEHVQLELYYQQEESKFNLAFHSKSAIHYDTAWGKTGSVPK